MTVLNTGTMYDDYLGTRSSDTSGVSVGEVTMPLDSITNVEVHGDTIIIVCTYPYFGPYSSYSTNGTARMQFVLDSNAHRLVDCSMSYSSTGYWTTPFPPYTIQQQETIGGGASFSGLPYEIVNDSVIVIDVDSEQCADLLIGAGKYESYDEHYYTRYPHRSGSSSSSESIDSNVFNFHCHATFKRYPAALLTVASTRRRVVYQGIAASHLSNGDVMLWLPTGIEEGMLSIVDVLGRTVQQLPIRTDQPRVDLAHLPPGLYFARLGEMTTSFVVP